MASNTPTGVDIGSTSIRAVETNRVKDRSIVTNFGHAPLAPGAVQGGIVNDERAVTGALKGMWSERKFRNRRVVLGVTSHQIVVREITLPNLPAKEFRQSLPFLVRDLPPLSVEKGLLDFYPLEKAKKAETMRGLLIAAPKEIVLPMVHAVQRAGLKVVRVDLASFAILRAAGHLDGNVEGIVDIGARTTSVVIHVDGQPRIVRTIPRGGADVSEALSKALSIPLEAAENLKRQVGLLPNEDRRIATVITETMRPLISELRSSFEYLAAGESQARVAGLSICGGTARMPGLPEALAEEFGVSVRLAEPLMRLRENRHRGYHDELSHYSSSAAVSVGLALAVAS